MNKDTLNTLFVGIDVSSKTNAVFAIDFDGKKVSRKTIKAMAELAGFKISES